MSERWWTLGSLSEMAISPLLSSNMLVLLPSLLVVFFVNVMCVLRWLGIFVAADGGLGEGWEGGEGEGRMEPSREGWVDGVIGLRVLGVPATPWRAAP